MPKEEGLTLQSIAVNELSLASKLTIALSLTVELIRLHDPKLYGGVHIHNDIKPSNIMVNLDNMTARFIDYGFATRSGEIFWGGTPLYEAPEYLDGKAPRRRSGDVYSLGLILFQLFESADNAFFRLPKQSV